jgi:hypothetical protein
MANVELYEKVNRLRAYAVNKELPEELAMDLHDVCDAAEKQADTENDFFNEF